MMTLPKISILIAFLLMTTIASKAELIILASPSSQDDYYQDVEDDIFDFHIQYAQSIMQNGDDVLILTDELFYDDYVET